MASNLLSFLENIDKGRRDIIKSLKIKGINTPDYASLNDINIKVQELGYIQGEDLKNNKNNIMYYENPFDDPEVFYPYSLPIKTIEDILMQEEDIEYTTTSGSKVILKPSQIFLIDANTESSIIRTGSAVNVSTYENELRLGYNSGWALKTNDGGFYYMNTNSDRYTHIWDPEKDLVAEDGQRYRYLIAYNGKRGVCNSGIGAPHQLRAIIGNIGNMPSNGGITQSAYFDYLKYYFKPIDSNTPYVMGDSHARYVEIAIGRDTNINLYSNNYIRFYGATTVINDCIALGKKISIGYNNVYYKTPIFSTGKASKDQDSGIKKLKYLEFEEDLQNSFIDKPTYYDLGYPLLKDPSIMWKINQSDLLNGSGILSGMTNIKYVDLSYFTMPGTDTPRLGYSWIGTLDLSGLTGKEINITNLIGTKSIISNLILSNIETVSGRIEINGLEEIHLEKCTSSVSFYPSDHIKKVYLNSLTSGTAAMINYPMLTDFILGKDYESDLYLNSADGINKEAVLRHFDNMKDFSQEGGTHTIKLPMNSRGKFTPEDLKKATNKGWTIQWDT